MTTLDEFRREESLTAGRNAVALATLLDDLNRRDGGGAEPDWTEAVLLAREMVGSVPSPEGWTNDRAAYLAMAFAHLTVQLATYGAGVTNELAERDDSEERTTAAALLQALGMAVAGEDV